MYLCPVVFVLASRCIRMMSRFGTKGFKSSEKVFGEKLALWISFILSIRQIGLIFWCVVSISYSGDKAHLYGAQDPVLFVSSGI